MCGDGKQAFRSIEDIKELRQVSAEEETTKPLTAEQILAMRQKKYPDEYMGILRDYVR
jgi:hypothetical protein